MSEIKDVSEMCVCGGGGRPGHLQFIKSILNFNLKRV